MSYFYIISFFLFYIIIIAILIYNKNKKKHKVAFTNIPEVKFPFKNIMNESNKFTNILSIVAPFRNKEHHKLYQDYKKQGFKFIGIASYLNFPNEINNIYDPANKENMSWYVDKCIGWLHCFRKPEKLFKKIPHILLSQSDFTDPSKVQPKNLKKKWDFVYTCLDSSKGCKGSWSAINKNWDLAKKCIKILCGKYKLKGLILGRNKCKFEPKIKKYITVYKQLPYFKFIITLEQAKFVFIPNILDASPRILTEALCLNLPILVNTNIIGGWKYVQPETGEFFSNEIDMQPALEKLLKKISEKKYKPRYYFSKHYGPNISGKILTNFIKTIYPDFTSCKLSIPYCCR